MNRRRLQTLLLLLSIFSLLARDTFGILPADRLLANGRQPFTHAKNEHTLISSASSFSDQRIDVNSNFVDNLSPGNAETQHVLYHEAQLVHVPTTITTYTPYWVYVPRVGTVINQNRVADPPKTKLSPNAKPFERLPSRDTHSSNRGPEDEGSKNKMGMQVDVASGTEDLSSQPLAMSLAGADNTDVDKTQQAMASESLHNPKTKVDDDELLKADSYSRNQKLLQKDRPSTSTSLTSLVNEGEKEKQMEKKKLTEKKLNKSNFQVQQESLIEHGNSVKKLDKYDTTREITQSETKETGNEAQNSISAVKNKTSYEKEENEKNSIMALDEKTELLKETPPNFQLGSPQSRTDIERLGDTKGLNQWVEIKKKNRKKQQNFASYINSPSNLSDHDPLVRISQLQHSPEGLKPIEEVKEVDFNSPDKNEESHVATLNQKEAQSIKHNFEEKLSSEKTSHSQNFNEEAHESMSQQISSSKVGGKSDSPQTLNAPEDPRELPSPNDKEIEISIKRSPTKKKSQGKKGIKKKLEAEKQEFDLMLESMTKLDEERRENFSRKHTLKSLTNSLLEKLSEIRDKDYERRDKLFSAIAQASFHPAENEQVGEIYPEMMKKIKGYIIDDDEGRIFANKIGLKIISKEDATTNLPKELELEADFDSSNKKLVELVQKHLNMSNPKEYLSLSDMDMKLYRKLQVFWYHDRKIFQNLPKLLPPQITREELYRRLETFSTQIHHHTIVENWSILKKYIIEKGDYTIQRVEAIEKDYQLSKTYPCVKDFSEYLFEKSALEIGKDENDKTYVLMKKIMGRQGAKYRLMLRHRVDLLWGKPPKIWKSKMLEEYYKYKGCSIVDIIDLTHLLELQHESELQGTLQGESVYLLEYFDPRAITLFVPWCQSSTRHFFLNFFKKNYPIHLSKKCINFNQMKSSETPITTGTSLDQKHRQGIFKLLNTLKSNPGDVVRFQDWGLDEPILRLLYLILLAEGKNTRLNWNLISSYYPINLKINQKREIENYLKSNI